MNGWSTGHAMSARQIGVLGTSYSCVRTTRARARAADGARTEGYDPRAARKYIYMHGVQQVRRPRYMGSPIERRGKSDSLMRRCRCGIDAALMWRLLFLWSLVVTRSTHTTGSSHSGSACPANTLQMGSTATNWTVCEATSHRNGSLLFIHSNGTIIAIEKTAEPLFGCNGADPGRNATAGCTGETNDGYLAQLGQADPTYSVIKGFLPPMVYDGGYNRMDPAHLPPGTRDPAVSGADAHFNVHTWVGSRSSWTDVAFDSNGGDISALGTPVMNQFPGKYHRSKAVFKDQLEPFMQREGLWGGWLPIVTFHFKIKPGGNSSSIGNHSANSGAEPLWIEWTACPVADMKGNRAQDVFFRVVKVAQNGAVIDARYFDTYGFRWADAVNGVPGMGQGPGSRTASRFYDAVLDQKVFWEHTFAADGVMTFSLPEGVASRTFSAAASGQTDGRMLSRLIWHSVVRDMIIRDGTWFPKYGIQGQWAYGKDGDNNCDITFVNSIELALEIGAFDFARGIMENFFQFDLREDGPRYRGPSFTSNAYHLEHVARYFTYTGDPTDILGRYHQSIMWLVDAFRAIRSQAKQLPPSSPAYGMPSGDTIDDVPGTSIECGTTFGKIVYDGAGGLPKGDCLTQLPFYGIAFGMVRGFNALGKVWEQKGGDYAAEGAKLLQEAAELRTDIIVSIRRSAVAPPGPVPCTVVPQPCPSHPSRTWCASDKAPKQCDKPSVKKCPPCPPPPLLPLSRVEKSSNVTCFPEIAGWGTCTTARDGKPGYNPPTIDIVAGRIQCESICREALLIGGSQDGMKLLVELEANDPRADDAWDFPSNLLKDNVRKALIALFDRAANQLTRGTWTGAEVAGHGLTSIGSGASTITSSTLPGFFKQLFCYDHPITHELWLGRAVPRAWLAPGQRVAVEGAPTRGGRIGLTIWAGTNDTFAANISLPQSFRWPVGGLVLRLRSPSFPSQRIKSATTGVVNATEESVRFTKPPASLTELQNVQVTMGAVW